MISNKSLTHKLSFVILSIAILELSLTFLMGSAKMPIGILADPINEISN